MNPLNMSPADFGNAMFGPDDERKERCIHCGKVWYAQHHRDGVCHSCQQKNLPGRTALRNRVRNRTRIIMIAGAIAAFILARLMFKF